MSEFAVPPSSRPRPPRRFWLPLALSLALHALFALAVVLVSSGAGPHAEGPAPVVTDVVTEDEGTIILDGPSQSGDGTQSSATATPPREEPPELLPSRVADLPVMTPVSVPSATGEPQTPGGGRGGDGDGGIGRGTGMLRAPAAAHSVVYVIDRSLSMGLSGALPIAKRELLAGLDALPADARFAVILYNRLAEPLSPGGQSGLLPATEANRAEVARLVDGARAEGGTDHLAALRRAVALGPEVIFFVTDADELTTEQVRNVALLNRGGAVIHAVELNNDGERRDETPLKLLARLSGGTHRVMAVNH